MATKKTTKKTPASKSRVAAKSRIVRSKAKSSAKSFQVIKEKKPFMTYQVTQQTIYWAILFIYILVLSLWILNIQLDTLRIIDKINTL